MKGLELSGVLYVYPVIRLMSFGMPEGSEPERVQYAAGGVFASFNTTSANAARIEEALWSEFEYLFRRMSRDILQRNAIPPRTPRAEVTEQRHAYELKRLDDIAMKLSEAIYSYSEQASGKIKLSCSRYDGRYEHLDLPRARKLYKVRQLLSNIKEAKHLVANRRDLRLILEITLAYGDAWLALHRLYQ